MNIREVEKKFWRWYEESTWTHSFAFADDDEEESYCVAVQHKSEDEYEMTLWSSEGNRERVSFSGLTMTDLANIYTVLKQVFETGVSEDTASKRKVEGKRVDDIAPLMGWE